MSHYLLCIYVCLPSVFPFILFIWHTKLTSTHKFNSNDNNAPGMNLLIALLHIFKLQILQVVGLAFEINSAYTDFDQTEVNEEQKDHEKKMYESITFEDIFHYTFNYVGLLTGEFVYFLLL